MPTHDVTVSAAECAECKRDHLPNCYRNQTVGHYGGGPADCDCGWRTLGLKHLQAQKDALWEAFCEWLGPEPIAAVMKIELIPEITLVHFENLKQALLRAQREAKK